jgi:hypothetical protein
VATGQKDAAGEANQPKSGRDGELGMEVAKKLNSQNLMFLAEQMLMLCGRKRVCARKANSQARLEAGWCTIRGAWEPKMEIPVRIQ